MNKCKDCEYFKIQDLPDEMNEGHALCTKHNLIVDLVGHQYHKKIDRLTCIKDDEFEPVKKMTNADRIRAMTDEELALFLDDVLNNHYDKKCSLGCKDIDCNECFLEWLQSEVKEK